MSVPTRMEMQANAVGLTLDQFKEMKNLEIDVDEYKELIKDKGEGETFLSESELKEFKESEMSFSEYMRKKNKNKSKQNKAKKSIDELSTEEKIEKLLGLEIAKPKKFEKFNLYVETDIMEKLITVAETTNMTVKDVINHILNKHLEKIDVNNELVANYKERTIKKRKGSKSAEQQ